MGRRGRSPSPVASRRSTHSSVPARAPAPASHVPATTHAAPPPMVAQPKQPGLFAQMATTAAGVAVGSAVGHTLGHALTGGMGGGGGGAEAAPVQEQQAVPQQSYGQSAAGGGACSYEIKQFLECAQSQHDLTLCDGFNEVVRQCKMNNGLM